LRIAQSPEGRRIFPRMTVLENLQMGASLDNYGFCDADDSARTGIDRSSADKSPS
jgi:ABC-type branched-subunit amino acid transport system ATPase component